MEYTEIVLRLRAAGCVFAEDEAGLLLDAADSPASLEAMLEKRLVGIPLEHILGWAEFGGLRIRVGEGVFVPRRRTEFLVNRAIEMMADLSHPVVLDLCCGSGALAAVVAAARPDAAIYAADVDQAAVDCARLNLPDAALVACGDLFEALPASLRGRVDVLLCNTPYVPTAAIPLMPPEARLHETVVALDGGDDGLDVQRRVAVEAPQWLAPGGHVLIEASELQASASARLFESEGLVTRVEHFEERNATIVISRRAA